MGCQVPGQCNLSIDAYIEGEIFINDGDAGFHRGEADTSAPLPNLGVDSSDWRGGAEMTYSGPVISLTSSW